MFPDVNRALLRFELTRLRRFEPELNLPFDREREIQIRQKRLDPAPRGQHEPPRRVLAPARDHARAFPIGMPAQDRFVETQFRALPSRQLQMRLDAPLRKENPGARLPHRHHILRRQKRRKTPAHVLRIHEFVPQAVLLRAPLRAADHRALRPTDHQAARLPEKSAAGFRFQLRPQFVGALNQGDVNRMFEIGLADDSCFPVRRTISVRRREPVEPQHPLAAPGEMKGGRAAHRAQPDNDHINRLQSKPSKSMLQL